MNCNEAVSLINPFIKDRLRGKKARAFLSHVQNCRECYDELEVRYLVEVTKDDLSDENDNYDFSHALSDEILKRKKRLRQRTFITIFFLILIIVSAAAAFYFDFWLR